MQSVICVAVTQPRISSSSFPQYDGPMTPEEFLAYVARVSNPSNQNNTLTAPKLLKYLVKNKHWSPFELCHLVMEINTTRDIGRQILRHRSFSFQEFCLSGNSLVTTIIPSTGVPNYIKISKLFERQEWKNYKNILLRVYNKENNAFETSPLKEVFRTGTKPLYKTILEDGKIIECTKEERFFSRETKEFDTLEDIVGLGLTNTFKAYMSKEGYIGVNGEICYQNYEWLDSVRKELPKKSLNQIAEIAGVTTHTIRKWLRIHNLQFTKKEVAEYTSIWNKGKFGYKISLKHSEEHLNSIIKARSGSNSNWWKGGVERSDRRKIADWCQIIRKKKLEEYKFSCKECGGHEYLELDHIIPVWQNNLLAYEYSNIQVLCNSCHKIKHGTSKEREIWRKRSKGNTLVPRFKKIVSVEYIGEQDTFDLEVCSSSHNFVANKIMVHNSQRYADPTKMEFVTREARLQDQKNRQNSIETDDHILEDKWKARQEHLISHARNNYEWAIENGIAKEQARVVLPEGLTPTRMFMGGVLRSWIHYCDLRMKPSTQKEHREIATMAWGEVLKDFPSLEELVIGQE